MFISYGLVTATSKIDGFLHTLLDATFSICRGNINLSSNCGTLKYELSQIIKQRLLFVLFRVRIHTYIIGHYSPSVRIIDLVSHTTYNVCVNFIHRWRDLQFNVGLRTTDFLRNFSWQFYLLLKVFARNLLRRNRRRNTFRISFCCLAWDSKPELFV